ncbi:hypothetical protein V5799_031278 [Amblyomma americanum]|uniref:Uncharacterized protein n=1 Tax=Amblyomma americanum TaxID=6943 RepID=A0AAQ4EKY0_AMBAM
MEYQHASDFTSVQGMLFVTKQTKRLTGAPKTLCQAIMKMRYIGGNSFQYIVYYAPPWARTTMKAFVTTLTTSRTPTMTAVRTHNNAITYETSLDGTLCSYKIMYADLRNGCFILVSFGPYCGRARPVRPMTKTMTHIPGSDAQRLRSNMTVRCELQVHLAGFSRQQAQ